MHSEMHMQGVQRPAKVSTGNQDVQWRHAKELETGREVWWGRAWWDIGIFGDLLSGYKDGMHIYDV